MKIEKFILTIAASLAMSLITTKAVAITKEVTLSDFLKTRANSTQNTSIAPSKSKKGKLAAKSSTKKAGALSRPMIQVSYIDKDDVPASTLAKSLPGSSISTNLDENKPAEFSGEVIFTAGRDSNLEHVTRGIEGHFYEFKPTLNFKANRWSGSFGASIKDFTEQEYSNLFKTNEAKANISYQTQISDLTTSNTKLDLLYHDERTPDYLQTSLDDYTPGTGNPGMPVRYGDYSITQSLVFEFTNRFKTEIGGKGLHRDSYSMTSDFAQPILYERYYQKDYNELTAFSKITLSAADFLDFVVTPSLKQLKYEDRLGRLSDGSVGGQLIPTPTYELITSELAGEVAFKFGGKSSVTPKVAVGQVSDEALGAEDNSYYSFGLGAQFVVESIQLTLAPSISYKKITYDRWTSGVPTSGETRLDDELTSCVEAKFMLTKNFGVGANYSMIKEASNKQDSGENYRDEVIASSLIFAF